MAGPAGDDGRAAAGLDGPVMRHVEPSSSESEDALISGVIEIEGDCLYLAFDEVGERYPVVWPASTAWDSNTGRVLLANGESVGEGDTVNGGGGYYYVGNVEAIAGSTAADRAGECVDNPFGEIAVVNNQPDAIVAGDQALDGEGPSVDSAEAVQLDGEWLVNDLIVDGERVVIDSTSPLTVSIEDETISGTASCNSYKGELDWSIEAGFGRFVVSELSWTEMGCAAEVMEVEQLFFTALHAVDSYEAADGLYVAKAGSGTNFHLVRPSGGG